MYLVLLKWLASDTAEIKDIRASTTAVTVPIAHWPRRAINWTRTRTSERFVNSRTTVIGSVLSLAAVEYWILEPTIRFDSYIILDLSFRSSHRLVQITRLKTANGMGGLSSINADEQQPTHQLKSNTPVLCTALLEEKPGEAPSHRTTSQLRRDWTRLGLVFQMPSNLECRCKHLRPLSSRPWILYRESRVPVENQWSAGGRYKWYYLAWCPGSGTVD